jgi:enterochelin esterase family protein
MKRIVSPRARTVAALAAISGCLACSSSSDEGGNTAGSGGSLSSAGTAGSGGAGVAGQASGGSAGSSQGVAGAAGAAGSAGSAAAGGGAGGAAGEAGAAGGGAGGTAEPGCEMLGSPGKTGIQCDPGVEGDGSFEQEQPAQGTPMEAMGQAQGMLTDQETFQSDIYGYGFNYRIYVPAQYEAGKPAALMIFQDGQLYYNEMNGNIIFDALIEEGSMPVTISVHIEPGEARSEEYDTRDDKYGEMLTTEFIPQVIEAQYDIVDDPNGWAIGGHSSGGCAAFNVAWFFNDKFHKVHTNNGSFTDLQDPSMGDYPMILTTEAPKPIRVTLASGTMDLGNGRWEQANDDMADALETAGYHYRYFHSTTNHNLTPFATSAYPDMLRWLWRGYTLPHYGQMQQ